MKTILTTLVTVVVSLTALPNSAEARPHCDTHQSAYTYRSGWTSCGCSVYTKRVFTGYDCYHRPIYRYYRVPVVHRCQSHHNPHYRNHRSHYRGNDYYQRNKRKHYRRHSRHISFDTRYGSIRICP